MVVTETAWESRDQGREPTTTLSGWRKFVDTAPARFDLLPDAAWSSLSPAVREAYNEARITYHSELVVVATSTLREVTKQGRLLTLLNRREISARRGLIVSGPWATGKSTAIKQLGRAYELMIRERAGGTDSNQNGTSDRIPVVYVTTPPKGSPRKLAMEFARFLGLPSIRTGWNTTDIADAVCQVLIDARCDLVLVDEIHNLNLATAAGEDMSDHLKYFTEHLPATFVYAGINVERSGLFTGVRGKQIAGRCVLASTGPFPYQQEWKSLVAAMESALRLHCPPGWNSPRHRPVPAPAHRRDDRQPLPPDQGWRDDGHPRGKRGHHPGAPRRHPGRPRGPVAAGGRRVTTMFKLAPRTLPRTVKPFPTEILSSYLNRLAYANRLDPTALRRYIAEGQISGTIPIDRLALVSGVPATALEWAIADLDGRQPAKTYHHGGIAVHRQVSGPACLLCAAARGITQPVMCRKPAERVICLWHQRWTGSGAASIQPSLDRHPDIVEAHRQHLRLVRRFGRDEVAEGFEIAATICQRWRDQREHDEEFNRRLSIFHGTDWRLSPADPTVAAAAYPQVVGLTRLIASPYWRGLAVYEGFLFQQEMRRTVAPAYQWPQPRSSKDPLRRWIIDGTRMSAGYDVRNNDDR
jgi:Bacterial TniB protein/TniQ